MKLKKMIPLGLIMGLIYICIEIIFTAIIGDLNKSGFNNIKYSSFVGFTSIWMIIVGGAGGLVVGVLNEFECNGKRLPIWLQSLIGTFALFTIELASGIILNKIFGLNIWDYSKFPLNLWGQVTILYIPLWYPLSIFAMWLDDVLRFHMFEEEKPDPLFTYYTDLFKGI